MNTIKGQMNQSRRNTIQRNFVIDPFLFCFSTSFIHSCYYFRITIYTCNKNITIIEKNAARKKLILERVEGYMKRAEELRDYVNKQNELGKNSKGGTGTKKKGEDGEDDADEEKAKLRGALSGAIVTEKPDVKWDDVAGLEGAKDSLKEVCVL
jgi:SpoVK/Ycf46/Vps4 family AAA+-type ATPase